MSGFSNFLTNFSGGTRIRSTDSSYNDLMSNAILVPSFNATGNNDGFIYLSNLLIQFSASTNNTMPYAGSSNTNFYFPIDTSSNNNFNPLAVYLTGYNNNNNAPIPILSSPWTGSYFSVRIGNSVSANITWFSIGLAPTYPIYTSIINFGSITNLRSVAIAGNIQYLCNNEYVYKNTTYGYGSWTQLTTLPTTPWTRITCSIDGKYVGVISSTLIYISSDYGSTWTPRQNTNEIYYSITCSSNGYFFITFQQTQQISFCVKIFKIGISDTFKVITYLGNGITTNYNNTYIYVSTDNGIYKSISDNGVYSDFIQCASFYTNHITTNSTGQYIAAAAESSQNVYKHIYISLDYGSNWSQSQAPLATWSSITSNSTGQLLTASTSGTNDGIYYSTDYGMNWNKTNGASNNDYKCINMNSAGNIATAITSSNVYVSFNAAN